MFRRSIMDLVEMHDHSYESFSVCIFMDVDRLSDFTPTHPKVLPLMLHIFNKVYPDMIETNYGHQKRKSLQHI